jgi:hypothetical protein
MVKLRSIVIADLALPKRLFSRGPSLLRCFLVDFASILCCSSIHSFIVFKIKLQFVQQLSNRNGLLETGWSLEGWKG